ncbi:hypothetical protein [Flaviaesturariibacter terrae]
MEYNATAEQEVLRDNLPPKLPQGLNVLTILTFIGCALGIIGVLAGTVMSKDYATQKAQLEDAADKAGDGFAGKMVQSQLESLNKHPEYYQNMYDYRYILFGSMLVFIVMCAVGAYRMRQLRKSGFLIYTIGELAPILVTIILVGFGGDGTWKTYSGYLLPIIFVALYAMQRKYLVRE